MAKGWYIGNESNIARKVKKMYIGDANGVVRKVKKVYIGDANNLARLAWSSGLGIVVGCNNNKQIFYSKDYGSTILATLPATPKGNGLVGFGNGMFVAVFYNTTGSSNSADRNTVFYSYDGVNWYPSNINLVNANSNYFATGIFFANNYIVILHGYGDMSYSTDGVNWATNYLRDEKFTDYVYANGYYFVSGDTSSVTLQLLSINVTTPTYSNGGDYLSSMCCGGGVLVAYRIYYGFKKFNFTTNKWELVSTITTSCNKLTGMAYGNGRFVAIYQYTVYYSLDGAIWTQASNSPYNIASLTFDGSNFVAGSYQGIYLYSKDGLSWTAVAKGKIDGSIYSIAGN